MTQDTQRLLSAQARLDQRMTAIETEDVPPTVARYTTNAGQAIPDATLTIVDFEDKTIDTKSAVTTGAGWVFTAPVGGPYRVSTHLSFVSSAAWAVGELLTISIYKNGSFYSLLWGSDNYAAGADANGGGSDIVPLAKGDTLNIRANQASGGPRVLNPASGANWVAIDLLTG